MKNTVLKKLVVRLLIAIAFSLVMLAGMVSLMSAIVYKDNTAFIVGVIVLVITVPVFSVLVWKEVSAYAENLF